MDPQETVIIDSEPVYDLKIEGDIVTAVVDESEIVSRFDCNELENKEDYLFSSMLCRFCTNPKGDDGINIFGCNDIAGEINEMIKLVFPGKIDEADGLTHFICLECLDKLRQCYEILTVFIAADAYFKNQLAELTGKIDQETVAIEGVTSTDEHTGNDLMLDTSEKLKEDINLQNPTQTELMVENSSQKCGLCSRYFSTIQALIIHKRIKHKLRSAAFRINHYKCQNCPAVFTSLIVLHLHVRSRYIRERNLSKIYDCQDCQYSFKRKYLLRAHRRENHKNHVCQDCGLTFSLPKSLAVHMQKEHSNTTCSVCGKKFKTSYWRIMHEKTHETDNCHLCWVCGKVCISKSSLRTHMAFHYSSKSYTCEICNKELKSASGLKHHKQIHTDRERTFKCNICEKAFTSKVILKQHGLSHSGLKPYACTNCGTQFNRLSNLNYHIKHYCSHKKVLKQQNRKVLKPAYQCEVCKSTFVSKLSYKYHLSRHTGNKFPFDCEDCGTVFSSVSGYRQHKRDHANNHKCPYVCDTCGKAFKTKGSLNVHSTMHSDSYPYSCPECNRSFKRVSSLKLHQSVHSGGKPYRCGICYRSFTRKGDAKAHLIKTHKVDVFKGDIEEVEYKYSEVVLDAKDSADFPVVAGEYVIQMADDVEVETTCETI